MNTAKGNVDMTDTKHKPAEKPLTGLDLLRAPFPANQISKLPKPTKAQTDAVRADFKKGIRCKVCGAWHHPDVVHLDYVGHAALTDRLLDCDTGWNWEPLAFTEKGTPLTDENGGMWIKLTVCNVTRLGYGHPDGKKGGDAIKELIGDALRNAAMRFGAALDLWHKGDLHAIEAGETEPAPEKPKAPDTKPDAPKDPVKISAALIDAVTKCATSDDLNAAIGGAKFDAAWKWLADHHEDRSLEVRRAVDAARDKFDAKPAVDLGGDHIPQFEPAGPDSGDGHEGDGAP